MMPTLTQESILLHANHSSTSCRALDNELSRNSTSSPHLTQSPPESPLRPDSGSPFSIREALNALWLTAFSPIVAGTYLFLCRSVRWKVVIVNECWMNFALSRSGLAKTSISTIIVTLALLPARCVISNVQSEEFFRALKARKGGLHLRVINNVSTPTYGLPNQSIAVLRRQTSGMSASTFFATLIVIVISTLAPAILSVELSRIDAEVVAIRVGAILKNTVVNSSELSYNPNTPSIQHKAQQVSSLPWIEAVLKATYRWDTQSKESEIIYGIPFPLNIPMGTALRYLSDVLVMTPTCRWAAPEFVFHGGDYINGTWALFPDTGSTGIRVDFTNVSMASYVFRVDMVPSSAYFRNQVTSHKELYPLADGSTIWSVAKCDPTRLVNWTRCPKSTIGSPVRLDTEGLPFSPYENRDLNKTWEVSFLICSPNLRVETREVIMESNNSLAVRPTDRPSRTYVRQRNLDETQSRFLIQQVMESSGGRSMTDLGYRYGSASQVNIIFGPEVASGLHLEGRTISPLPIREISKNYGAAVRSLMKAFLDGSVASSVVPARHRKLALILTSSFPHVVVSSVLFALLSVIMAVCHFRSPVPQFNFISIAGSLADSQCQETIRDCQVAESTPGDHAHSEEKVLEALDRMVVMEDAAGYLTVRFFETDNSTS